MSMNTWKLNRWVAFGIGVFVGSLLGLTVLVAISFFLADVLSIFLPWTTP